MEFKSQYVSKKPDADGFVNYTVQENAIWRTLFERQIETIVGRACEPFLTGLENLNITAAEIPQLPEVNQRLNAYTGWQVEPVKALITAEEFFQLLANRRFPAATFIRNQQDLNYIQEPDIFHELFGHCPLLTETVYADFLQDYAKLVLSFDKQYWPLLQRFFWFTVEFGLIQTEQGLRIYGGGILSSIGETQYSVESLIPQRQLFNPLSIFRTPYRIDIMQPVYFVISSFNQLFEFMQNDVHDYIQQACELGEFPPLFELDDKLQNIHIRVC